CIINDSRCPLVNSPDFICLKHTAVLSNQKANQLSKGCYLTKYLSNSVIVFTTNLFFILSNMMKCGPRTNKRRAHPRKSCEHESQKLHFSNHEGSMMTHT